MKTLTNGIECLYKVIALLYFTMLTHGVGPAGLQLSTLVPIPKHKRGNKSDLNNYWQIAISSLLGKLFDTIILEEQHHGLITDELQFDFQKKYCAMYFDHCEWRLLITIMIMIQIAISYC